MATYLKDPPPFVKSLGHWEYTLDKLAASGKLDEGGNPLNYAAAIAIYKNVVNKYPAMPRRSAEPTHRGEDGIERNTPSLLDEIFPVGSSFWWDDCIVTATDTGHGLAVFSDPKGKLMIRGRIEDVDPKGPHKNWLGQETALVASRCLPLDSE